MRLRTTDIGEKLSWGKLSSIKPQGEQSTNFELVVNLKAAKQIGLTIAPNGLARGEKIIRENDQFPSTSNRWREECRNRRERLIFWLVLFCSLAARKLLAMGLFVREL